MRYPLDVNSRVKRSGRITSVDKVKLGLGILLIVNIVFTIFFAGFFRSIGIPTWALILLQFILFLFIFSLVFRFAIFREQDRDLDESDVFMQYYKFRPGSKQVRLPIGEVSFFELKNNWAVSAIQFKFGSNDANKKVVTENFFKDCVNILGEKRLDNRFLILTERFMDTPEFAYHFEKINAVREPKLRSTLLEVYSNTFGFSEIHSSAETIVLLIYASSSFLKDELEDAVVQIDALYKKTERAHAFRKFEFLNMDALLEIFREFYGMGAVDLSLSKIQLHASDPDILKSVLVYRIISEEGKKYTSPVFDKITTKARKLN